MLGYVWLNFVINSWNAGPSFLGSEVSHQVSSARRSLGSVVWLAGLSLPQPAAKSARPRAATTTPVVRMRIGSPVDERPRHQFQVAVASDSDTFLQLSGALSRALLCNQVTYSSRDGGTLARLCRRWKSLQRSLQELADELQSPH